MRNRRFRFGRSIVTLQPPRTVREVRDPAAARALAYSVHEQLGRAYVEALLQDFTGPFFDERRDDATLMNTLCTTLDEPHTRLEDGLLTADPWARLYLRLRKGGLRTVPGGSNAFMERLDVLDLDRCRA